MTDHVQQLEIRLSDTRVSGTRVQSSEEAKQAAAGLEAALQENGQRALAGDPAVSVSRWKDTGALCTLAIQVAVKSDILDAGRAAERMSSVARRVQDGAFR